MTPEKLSKLDAILASQIGDDVQNIYDHETLFKEVRVALQAQAAELATLRAERDAAIERCAVACDKIAGNTADFSRDHRRAAGQCAAMIRALKGGA